MIFNFPFSTPAKDNQHLLQKLGNQMQVSLFENSERKVTKYSGRGEVITRHFIMHKNKPIIDEIDQVLARHYGFTDEELDFIINYDIKYRMGRGAGNTDDEY